MNSVMNWSIPRPQNPARNIPDMSPTSVLVMPCGMSGSAALLSAHTRSTTMRMQNSAKARLS